MLRHHLSLPSLPYYYDIAPGAVLPRSNEQLPQEKRKLSNMVLCSTVLRNSTSKGHARRQ